MSNNHNAAGRQTAAFETERKVNLVVEWLQLQALARLRAAAHGRLMIELTFEAGKITRAKLNDETTVVDLTERERELVLRQEAERNSKNPE